MRVLICVVAVIGIARATTSDDGLLLTAIKTVKDCENRPLVLCLKERALRYIDSNQGDIKLAEGVEMVKTDEIPVGRSLQDIQLSEDGEVRENEVDSLLVDRIARFFGTHTLQFKVSKDSVMEIQRSLEEARRKKKAKRILMPLLLLLKLKAAALLPLVIGFLALIAFKALIVGKLALLLSGIIGLKKLLEAKNSTQNYEVVAHPQYSHSSVYDDHGSHYARSLSGNDLAYAAQL